MVRGCLLLKNNKQNTRKHEQEEGKKKTTGVLQVFFFFIYSWSVYTPCICCMNMNAVYEQFIGKHLMPE